MVCSQQWGEQSFQRDEGSRPPPARGQFSIRFPLWPLENECALCSQIVVCSLRTKKDSDVESIHIGKAFPGMCNEIPKQNQKNCPCHGKRKKGKLTIQRKGWCFGALTTREKNKRSWKGNLMVRSAATFITKGGLKARSSLLLSLESGNVKSGHQGTGSCNRPLSPLVEKSGGGGGLPGIARS